MANDIEQIAPTPWADSSAMTFIVVDAANNPVCTCSSGGDGASLRRDHIIACVNAHAKLVTACETALYVLESTQRIPKDLAILRLRAALRQQEKNDGTVD